MKKSAKKKLVKNRAKAKAKAADPLKPNENQLILMSPDKHTDFEFELAYLREYGYLSTKGVTGPTDNVFVDALAKYEENDPNVATLCDHLGKPLVANGSGGPAVKFAMRMPRCGCADLGRSVAAVGSGGWSGCLVEGEHGAICKIDSRSEPSHWTRNKKEILKVVQFCNAQHGLVWRFVDENDVDILTGENLKTELGSRYHVNTTMRYRRGNGWIGLATVGSGREGCRSYFDTLYIDPGYGSNFDHPSVVWQLAALLIHELGHHQSYGHIRSGNSRRPPENPQGLSIMNPGIQWWQVQPSWIGGPHESSQNRQYGGEPAKIPGVTPDPDPPDTPTPPGEYPSPGTAITPAFNVRGNGNCVIMTVGGNEGLGI